MVVSSDDGVPTGLCRTVHTTVRAEIVLDMISAVRCFRHFFWVSSYLQVRPFDDKIVCVETAGEFTAIQTVAWCLEKGG